MLLTESVIRSDTTLICAAGTGHSAKRFAHDSELLDTCSELDITGYIPESPGLTWDVTNLDDGLELVHDLHRTLPPSRLLLAGHSAGATFMSRLAPIVEEHYPGLVQGLWLYSGTWDGTIWRWWWPRVTLCHSLRSVVCSWDCGERKWARREMLKAGAAYRHAGIGVHYLAGSMGRHVWDPALNRAALTTAIQSFEFSDEFPDG